MIRQAFKEEFFRYGWDGVYEERMNQQLLLDFLRRLVADSDRRAFLISDNLRVHHGKIVAAWLAEYKNEIEVFSCRLTHRRAIRMNISTMPLNWTSIQAICRARAKTSSAKSIPYMRRLQHRRDSVSAFFRHEPVSYI
jgi:hypothetical protein